MQQIFGPKICPIQVFTVCFHFGNPKSVKKELDGLANNSFADIVTMKNTSINRNNTEKSFQSLAAALNIFCPLKKTKKTHLT